MTNDEFEKHFKRICPNDASIFMMFLYGIPLPVALAYGFVLYDGVSSWPPLLYGFILVGAFAFTMALGLAKDAWNARRFRRALCESGFQPAIKIVTPEPKKSEGASILNQEIRFPRIMGFVLGALIVPLFLLEKIGSGLELHYGNEAAGFFAKHVSMLEGKLLSFLPSYVAFGLACAGNKSTSRWSLLAIAVLCLYFPWRAFS